MIRNYIYVIRVFILLLLFPAITFSQEKIEVKDSVVISEELTIPLTEIPESAESIENYLNLKVIEIISEPIVFENKQVLDSLLLIKDELIIVTNQFGASNLPIEFYQNTAFKWEKLGKSLEVPKSNLQEYSTSLNTIVIKLSEENDKWIATQEKLIADSLMPEIVERIEVIRLQIDSVTVVLTDSLSAALNLQSVISDVMLEINTTVSSLKSKKQDDIFSMLEKKETLLWEIDENEEETDSTKMFTAKVLFQYLTKDSKDYLKDKTKSIIKLFFAILSLFWLFFWLKRKSQDLQFEKDKIAYNYVFKSLIATVLIYAVMLIYWYLPDMPYIINSVFNIVLFVPFIIISVKTTNKKLKWGVVYLFGLFSIIKLNSFYNTIFTNGLSLQILTLFVGVALVIYLYWIFKNRKFVISIYSSGGFWIKLTAKLSPIFLILNIVSVIVGISGYVGLSAVISYGTLVSFLTAPILQVFTSNASSFIHLLFRTKFAQGSRIIKANTERVQKFIEKVLFIGSIIFWIKYTLVNLMLYTLIEDWGSGLRETGYQFGETQITIGGIIDFFIIIIVFWILSNFIKLLLRDEILSRLNLSRGIPMAVSTIVQYIIVIIGIAMAMSSIGFDTSNLGILAGALGVGIGFGLQSIVGNFISGLILIFERPIAVGDVIIADNVEGTVTKIGIRASTILLYNNSEVIVPNQDLISKQVTNLTLTNETRRKELSIYTNLNADPKKVMQLMEIAASEVKDVMKYPEPQAAYKGIVDQSHEFIVYFRLSENMIQAQSDVALSVISKLKEAEIDMYIPKKVVVESKDSSAKFS